MLSCTNVLTQSDTVVCLSGETTERIVSFSKGRKENIHYFVFVRSVIVWRVKFIYRDKTSQKRKKKGQLPIRKVMCSHNHFKNVY